MRDEDQDTGDRSPKASSDPGSEHSSEHFSIQRHNVDMFSQRVNRVWRNLKARQSFTKSSTSRTNGAVEASDATDRMLDAETFSQDVQSICSRFSDESPISGHLERGHSAVPSPLLNKLCESLNPKAMAPGESHQLSSAFTVVDSIPEHVREVLQQRAHILADDVQSDVADVRKMIRDSETSDAKAEEAIERLEVIPDLIRKSFGVSLAKMQVSVQRRVDGVIKRSDRSNLASELSSIPEEILQMAEEAVGEAVQESKAQATQQLAFALESAPKTVASNPVALQQVKSQIISHMPQLPVKPQEARNAATDTIEQAVALCHDETAERILNRDVADALLRAKQGSMVTSLGGAHQSQPRPRVMSLTGSVASSSQQAPNPGSVGHPEYCPRPCLFYPSGKCTHGAQCGFCHLSHMKRPTHLDKRHREMIKNMPFAECASIVVPIMRSKVVAMSMGQGMQGLLEALGHTCMQPAPTDTPALERALRALPFRTLTTILHRSVPAHAPERIIIDGIVNRIRRASDISESECASSLQWGM